MKSLILLLCCLSVASACTHRSWTEYCFLKQYGSIMAPPTPGALQFPPPEVWRVQSGPSYQTVYFGEHCAVTWNDTLFTRVANVKRFFWQNCTGCIYQPFPEAIFVGAEKCQVPTIAPASKQGSKWWIPTVSVVGALLVLLMGGGTAFYLIKKRASRGEPLVTE